MQITSTTTRVTTVSILAQKRLDEQTKTSPQTNPSASEDAVTKLLNWTPNQPGAASEVINKLKEASKEAVNGRKGAARQRLDQLKAQLQMLRNSGADPKLIARIAKQLAQELKSIAKDYASAVKDEGGMEIAQTGSPGKIPGAADPAAPLAIAPETATGTVPPENASSAKNAASTPSDTASPAKEDRRDPDAERKDYADKLNQKMADSNARFFAKKADQEVLEEFKKVAEEIKSLLRQGAHALRKAKGNGLEADDLTKAGKEMDKAVQEIAEALEHKGDQPDSSPLGLTSDGATSYSSAAVSVSVEITHQISISA